jgi:alpha-1,6-mannosyltransferase
VLATAASTLIVLVLIGLTYNRLPWRKLPDTYSAPAQVTAASEPPLPPPQAPKPDAYAESP